MKCVLLSPWIVVDGWMDGWGGCMSRAMEGHSELMNGKKRVSPDTYTSSIFWWVLTSAGSLWPFPYEYFHIHHFMALNPNTLNPKDPAVCKKLVE